MGKTKMKRTASWIIILVMLLTLLPSNAVAQAQIGDLAVWDGENIQAVSGSAAVMEEPITNTSLIPESFAAQPGGNNIWRVTGALGTNDGWDIGNEKTIMSHLVGEYYVISMILEANLSPYEFKFTKNGGWDNSIGYPSSDGDGNFILNISKKSKVNFYLNDEKTGLDKVRISVVDEDFLRAFSTAPSMYFLTPG